MNWLNEPSFREVWTSRGYSEFTTAMRAKKVEYRSQTYYRIRSLVRIGAFIAVLAITNALLGEIDSW